MYEYDAASPAFCGGSARQGGAMRFQLSYIDVPSSWPPSTSAASLSSASRQPASLSAIGTPRGNPSCTARTSVPPSPSANVMVALPRPGPPARRSPQRRRTPFGRRSPARGRAPSTCLPASVPDSPRSGSGRIRAGGAPRGDRRPRRACPGNGRTRPWRGTSGRSVRSRGWHRAARRPPARGGAAQGH